MNHNSSMKTSNHGKKKSKKRTSSGIASSSLSSTTITSSDNSNHKDHHDNNNKNNVVTIQVIQSNDNHENQHPIVCSFPGGIPSSCTSSTSSEEQEQQLTFQWLKKSKSTMNRNNSNINGQEYLIKGQDTACQYYGNCIINNNNTSTPSNTSTTSSLSSSHTKLCVAIYDKFTNKLVVTPTIGNGTIITLQQFVPSYYNNKKEIDDDNTTTTRTATTNALLFADFGSAKKRRVLQSQEANRVTVDAVVAIGTTTSSNKNNKNNNANDMIFHNSKMSESNRIAIQQQQQMNMAIEATTTPSGNNNIDDNDDDDVEQGQGTTNNNNTNTNSTNSSMNLAIEIATNSWRQTFLPNYNINAKHAKDIYNISLIVGYDIWNHTLQNIIKKYNILNDNGTSIIQYFNRNNISNNSSNASHPYHSHHKDIIYCTELVQKLIETKIKYNNTQNQNHNQNQQLELYKCILLLNYFICLYKQFQSNKFKLPMISTSLSDDTNENDDNDDNIDNHNTDINETNDNTNNVKRNTLSLRTKLYGTTPISIIQRFLDLFTTSTNFDHTNTNSNTSNTKHIMSRAQQDKCLVHIFIIYIMTYANGMNGNNKNNNIDKGIVISDIVPLFYELQLNDNINHGILLLRQAGCIVTRTNTPSSFSSSKDTNSSKPQKKIKVELNVPLTFPKTKKKQR